MENVRIAKSQYFKILLKEFYLAYDFFYLKDHGADDDLKLLNVIETFCKVKPRQSVNVHVTDVISSAVNKSSILHQPAIKALDNSADPTNLQNFVGSTTSNNEPVIASLSKSFDSSKGVQKLIDEKARIESNFNSALCELKEYKQSNKELKMVFINFLLRLHL